MRGFRWFAAIVVLLVAAAGVFYWFLPAGIAVPLLARKAPGLVLGDLSGTLWDGRAGRVATADGRELGAATWRLGRDAILGRIHLDLHLDGRAGRFDGHLDRTGPDAVTWSAVDFRLDAAAVAAAMMPAGTVPAGVVEGRVPRAELQGNWPVALDADVAWRKASVRTPEGDVTLGGIALKANVASGVMRATVGDDGSGSLAVDAVLAASPLGWRMEGKLVPRVSDSALTRLIARFGPVARDGSVNLQRKAGLAPRIEP
ncbi:type II secretion system protein N [Luteibacter sp. 329MFSha]|uniref:type II secretion system protein N n=1 Tax=Luteibacter sp. 329MFSha TaxID=1798239 RepID=UPI0008AE18A3|nr:type II secretion system protein N [Luteibacter sp. 329MFSha]SEW17400.1 general secretion pathway protein N [Luteibacter sp. 329MFSha]